MSCNCEFAKSSIGRKILVAITGLLLFGFLISHLVGNFLMFDVFGGAESYNNYSHALVSNPLIYIAEFLLVAIFLAHVLIAIKITVENCRARPVSYAVSKSLGERSIASSTMIWSGAIIFYFIVIHLVSLKFGEDVSPPSADGVRDIYSLVITRFGNTWYSTFYILCMVVMGFHLSHALQSMVKTLGLSHPKYLQLAQVLSVVTGVGLACGYSIFPIYFGFIR